MTVLSIIEQIIESKRENNIHPLLATRFEIIEVACRNNIKGVIEELDSLVSDGKVIKGDTVNGIYFKII